MASSLESLDLRVTALEQWRAAADPHDATGGPAVTVSEAPAEDAPADNAPGEDAPAEDAPVEPQQTAPEERGWVRHLLVFWRVGFGPTKIFEMMFACGTFRPL